jgi:uncharacterized protein (TIGR03435 family)
MGKLILLALVSPALIFGQENRLPTFDVATVREDHSVDGTSSEIFLPSGQVELHRRTMESLITEAWNIEARQLAGVPPWLGADKYDVIAKAAPGTQTSQIRLMLKALLMERFGLQAHMDDRITPSYSLVLGRGKPALHESDGLSSNHGCTLGSPGNRAGRTCVAVTMKELAELLSAFAPKYIDPVVDMTGLNGKYDFVLVWTRLIPRDGQGPALETDPNQRTLEDVVRDLGLILRRTQRMLPTLVIDHIERDPTEQ